MSFIEDIRKQPHHKKIRLIWICSGIAVIILIILWAATWHFRKDVPRDTTLFETIGRGFNDLKNNYNKPIP
jgi:hypothetical protein